MGGAVAVVLAVTMAVVAVAGFRDWKSLPSVWFDSSARFWDRLSPPYARLLRSRRFQNGWWSFVLAFATLLGVLGVLALAGILN